jgi:uncharacterized membrane protein YfcA
MVDSFWAYPLLFLTGLVAGWIDSIAGGGGLITIPVLFGIGLPPQLALGTNKFQASFGSFTAAMYHVRRNVVRLRDAWLGIVMTLVGAAIGTWAVAEVRPGVLNLLIPVLLLGIAVYMLVVPVPTDADRRPKFSRIPFYLVSGLALGFYDGFFGPGVGSFWAIAFVIGMGFHLTKATGYTKVMNFTSNIVSFLIFLARGDVMVWIGITMAIGQILGARLGSGLVIRRGARFIRPVFVTVVILTTLKLIYDRLV